MPPCCHCHRIQCKQVLPCACVCPRLGKRACACTHRHGSPGLRLCVLSHTVASSSAAHCRNPLRGQHKVSISEAHFCAMDIEAGGKESRLLSMMDGFSRGLPRVVLKGAAMEPRGTHRFTTFPCFSSTSVSGSVCSAASLSHLHSSLCFPLPCPPNSPQLPVHLSTKSTSF